MLGWFLGWMGFGVLFPFPLLLPFGRQETSLISRTADLGDGGDVLVLS